nr:pantoate--beta-alanine ligase [Flavobacteriales bacterium]
EELATEPAVVLDHFGVADALDLRPLDAWGDRSEAVALIAARVGPVRLIDNITLVRNAVPQ